MEIKTKEYYEGLDKRSREYKQYKKSLEMPSLGVGDDVEKVLNSKLIKPLTNKVKKFIWGDSEDCGCDERKAYLNKIFKYNRVECLEEYEFNYLKDLFPRIKSKIDTPDQEKVLVIYNRVFNEKQEPTQCGACWRGIIKKVRRVYDEYVKEMGDN